MTTSSREALPAQIIEAIQNSVSLEGAKDLFTRGASELKRLIVFAPRITPFSHRHLQSIRHPMMTQLLWRRGISSDTNAATPQAEIRSLLDDVPSWQLTDRLAHGEYMDTQRSLWSRIGEDFDPIITSTPLAIELRDSIAQHPSWVQGLVAFWNRIVVPQGIETEPTGSRPGTGKEGKKGASVAASLAGQEPWNSPIQMTQEQYFYNEIRLTVTLLSPYGILECLEAIEEDFFFDARDSKPSNSPDASALGSEGHHENGADGGDPPRDDSPTTPGKPAAVGVSFQAFSASMLELADNWTCTTHVDEYVAFLWDLFNRAYLMTGWPTEYDAILFGREKKKIANQVAITQFVEWQQSRAKKKDFMKKYLSNAEAEELERRKVAGEGGPSTMVNSERATPLSTQHQPISPMQEFKDHPLAFDSEKFGGGGGDSRSSGKNTPGGGATVGANFASPNTAASPGAASFQLEAAELARLPKSTRLALLQQQREERKLKERQAYRAIPSKLISLTTKSTLVEAVAQVRQTAQRQRSASPRRPQ